METNTEDKKITLTCWGGVGETTGANFHISCEAGDFLVDCGLVQGGHFAEEENREDFQYDVKKVKALFITHAHLDHIGRIPKLVKDGFRGEIYSTEETRLLTEVMFEDALGLLRRAAQERGEKPLYEEEDVAKANSLWKTLPYRTRTEIAPGFSVYLKDAGHILGSAMYEIHYGSKKMLFTGDLGNSPAPLLPDTESPSGADYVLMESVYGDRNHESKEERDATFEEVIKDTIERGGAVVIPTFSLERTQNILYALNNLIEGGKIPSVPVFLDSPLAIKVTEIYESEQRNFKRTVQDEIAGGDDIFNFPKLKFSKTTQDSLAIERTQNPKIILAGSGMSAGGRVTRHEEKYLPDKKSTIMLVGYQSVGTLGRRIQEGAREIIIEGRKIPIRARVLNIRGFSSHKDSDHLVEFVAECKDTVKKVFVAMGEPKSSLFLTQKLRDNLEVDAIVPERGKPYELEF